MWDQTGQTRPVQVAYQHGLGLKFAVEEEKEGAGDRRVALKKRSSLAGEENSWR